MLENFVVPQMQMRHLLDSFTLVQDGVTPYIELCIQQSLWQHFTNDTVISCEFLATWPSRLLDLYSCDFWPWDYLKNFVYRGRLVTLADLKDGITLHVRTISIDQLRFAVEQAVH